MSLFSKLLGAKPARSGPDFEQLEPVVIRLDKHELSYAMPGNLSNFYGFAEKRAQWQLPRSLRYRDSDIAYKSFLWRNEHFVDAGRWDYLNQRERELASLELSIDIVRAPLSFGDRAGLAEYLRQCYEIYLEGPEGLNTKIRQECPEDSDDDLEGWLVNMPAFEPRPPWVHWRVFKEVSHVPTIYYAQPLDDCHFLMVNFRYSMTGEKGYQLRDRIEQDIQRIFSSFSLMAD